jgi:carbamoyltransferase
MIVLGYSGFTRDLRRGGRVSPFAKTGLGPGILFDFHEGEVPLPMFPLGFFGHDASACLLIDGQVVACAAEERFTRCKHALNLAGNTLLPRRATAWCLEHAGIKASDVDAVSFYCDFQAEDLVERNRLLAPHVPASTLRRVQAVWEETFAGMVGPEAVAGQCRELLGQEPPVLIPVRHHLAHAASAFYPSGFEESLILTIDGSGEIESSMLAIGGPEGITELDHVPLPTSLGTLYLALTVYLGFRGLGDEFKVMGLAAYGDPGRHRRLFDHLVHLDDAGRYDTFGLIGPDLRERLATAIGPPRRPDEPVTAAHADAAAGLQDVLERAVLHSLAQAKGDTGLTNLSMAGGVALNCALNGRIARSGLFSDIFVQPAASDEGGSVGAALYAWHREKKSVPHTVMGRCEHVFFGPAYGDPEILAALQDFTDAATWRRCEDPAADAATMVASGQVIGWFQGAMEFGPRALGHRSILADPRDPAVKDRVNEMVKHREPFRPFAPAVIEEEADNWFDMTGLRDSPYMLFTVPVLPFAVDRIPAVTHHDGTARVQTVSKRVDPLFHRLIETFGKITGVPILLNTSFNVNREPIVCSPHDALRCFLGTDIDGLFLGKYCVTKRDHRGP